MSNLLPDDDPRLASLCRMGAGPQCCRWLARKAFGMFCTKLDPDWHDAIEQAFAEGTMNSRGDNCPGLPPSEDDQDDTYISDVWGYGTTPRRKT